MTKEKPFIICRAHCTCLAGLGEACTLVSGLLFALKAHSAKQNEIPCTSKKCNWKGGYKRKKEAKEVSEIKFKKLRYGEESSGVSQKKEITLHSTAENDFLVCLTSNISKSSSRPVLFNLMPAGKETYDINDEISVVHYEEVSTSEIIPLESDKYMDVLKIFQEENLNEQEINEKLIDLPKRVIEEIEKRTIGQSNSSLWILARKFRLTSSNFHDIITRKKENVEKLVSKFTQESFVETPALINGGNMTKIARNKYIAYKRLHQHEKVAVRECGIVLDSKYGYLGASPDGLVTNKIDTCREWVLEIKCPFKWRHKTFKTACNDKDFCCEAGNDGKMQFKRSHRYVAHIQVQMGICKCRKCDFVIFLFKDFLLLEIEFDEEYWTQSVLKLAEFYGRHMVPFLLESANAPGNKMDF